MASFTDLVKAQKSAGSGSAKALAAISGRKALEKMDPRNYLFNRSGLLSTLIPGLKGYQAKADVAKSVKDVPSKEISDEKLNEISAKISLMTKNTMVLPSMARDMNVMKQGIIKLVKSQGGTQRDKADKFFMTSKDREAAYEAQFGKKSTSPTKESGQSSKDKGFLSSLLGMGLGGLLSSLLAGLIKGGLIVGLLNYIGKYFTDPEFRKSVNETIDKLLTSIFGPDYFKNITVGLTVVVGAVAAVKAALIAFEVFMYAMMRRMGRAMGLPIPDIPGAPERGPGGGKGGGKTPPKGGRAPGRPGGRAGLLAGAAAIFGLGSLGMRGGAEEEATSGAPGTTSPQVKKESNLGGNLQQIGISAVTGGVAAAGAVTGAKNIMETGKSVSKVASYSEKAGRFVSQSGKFVSAKDIPKGEMLKKFIDFAVRAQQKGWIPKVLGKLGARLGASIAIKAGTFLAGLAAAPFTAGLSLLINLALLGYDAYLIYDAIFGNNCILKELEEEEVNPPKAPNNNNPPYAVEEKSSDIAPTLPTPAGGVTPGAAPGKMVTELPSGAAMVSQSSGIRKPTKAQAPSEPMKASGPAVAGEKYYSIGGGLGISSSDVQKIISKHEGDAESIYGDYRKGGQLVNNYGPRPPEWAAQNLGKSKPLTEFTMRELLQYQRQRPKNTGAAGIAGFMPTTLFGKNLDGVGGLFAASGLSWDDKFSEDNQKKLQQIMSKQQDDILGPGLKKLGIEEITPGMKLAANYVGPQGLLWTIEEGQKNPNITVREALMKHQKFDPTIGPDGTIINKDLRTTKASEFVGIKEAFVKGQMAKMNIPAADISGLPKSETQTAAVSPTPAPSGGTQVASASNPTDARLQASTQKSPGEQEKSFMDTLKEGFYNMYTGGDTSILKPILGNYLVDRSRILGGKFDPSDRKFETGERFQGISSATREVEEMKSKPSAPIVINAPTTNNQSSTSSPSSGSPASLANVVDTDFMKMLFDKSVWGTPTKA